MASILTHSAFENKYKLIKDSFHYDIRNFGSNKTFCMITQLIQLELEIDQSVLMWIKFNKKLSYRLETGHQQCISLKLIYFISP